MVNKRAHFLYKFHSIEGAYGFWAIYAKNHIYITPLSNGIVVLIDGFPGCQKNKEMKLKPHALAKSTSTLLISMKN